MYIYNKEQIRKWDSNTVQNQNITSFDLMERAAEVFYKWFVSLYCDKSCPIAVFAGSGNNGGDALAIGRMLCNNGYLVQITLIRAGKILSKDCESNLLLIKELGIPIIEVDQFEPFTLTERTIIIDGIFGTGLSKPPSGVFEDYIEAINILTNKVISIDLPSGLDADLGIIGPTIIADRTLSFEIPKKCFFLDECQTYLGEWDYKSIHLIKSFQHIETSNTQIISRAQLIGMVQPRKKTNSKYDFGFGQLCSGSKGMLGAAILAARAAMSSGIGRLSLTIPSIYHSVIFGACPTAMVDASNENNEEYLEAFSVANKQITALACGPGISTREEVKGFVDEILRKWTQSLVLDADALNIISREKWLSRIPENTIITPHSVEFDRLFGPCSNHLERLEKQVQASQKHQITIILKGAHTSISNESGRLFFNTTGNVGMAKAGSGDVLTGMLLSLLAQGYSTEESSQLAVYLHGLAGDFAADKYGVIGMSAEDIIEFIPFVFKNIYGR